MNTIQPNSWTGELEPHELESLQKALAMIPPPPYVVTALAGGEPGPLPTVMWTLQRATTPEGVEPGLVWPVYVDTKGRQVSGPARDKTLPPPTVPVDAPDVELEEW